MKRGRAGRDSYGGGDAGNYRGRPRGNRDARGRERSRSRSRNRASESDHLSDGGPARVVRVVPAPATALAPISVTFSVDQSGRGSTTISKGHREVGASLKRLGCSTELEVKFATQDGRHSVDIAAKLPGTGLLVAVEFDGPSHYRYPVRRQRTNKSVMRDRIILRSGAFAGLVVVPYFEWDELDGIHARQNAYLADRLRDAGLGWALRSYDRRRYN